MISGIEIAYHWSTSKWFGDVSMYRKKDIAEKMMGVANPFMENYKFPVTMGRDHSKHIKSYDGVLLPKPYYMERTEITSVFHGKDIKDQVMSMSDRAQRMYLYILYSLTHGQDYIIINPDKYMKANGIKSLTTFKLAKMELSDGGFISKANPLRTYWINPAKFFCGSRPNRFPENRQVTHEI